MSNRIAHREAADQTRDLCDARLEQLRDELLAEGADPSKRLSELQRRADAWPE